MKHPEEGWIPSPELMWQLISIAPLSWYERLASIAVREGLIKTPTDWSRDPGEFVPGVSVGENARYLIEDMGIEGHEGKLDLPLLWEQLIAADHAEINRDFRIELPNIESDQARRRFLDNDLPLRIVMPSIAASIETTAWELLQALASTAPGGYHVKGPSGIDHPMLDTAWRWIKFADTIEGQMWAHEVLAFVVDVGARRIPPLGDEFRAPLEEAARAILRKHGYLRGPCERCSRKWWLVSEPKPKGRPPLVYRYCPPCVEIIKRTQSAERMRKSRGKKKA